MRRFALIYQKLKFGMVKSTQVQKSFKKQAIPPEEFNSFISFAQSLCMKKEFKNTVFVDQVYYTTEYVKDIKKLLVEHISKNIVKVLHSIYLI